ncbi:MAG: lysophospholipid acyltransferase family protein [Chitinophagales bacterium]|nr:lysophospholipid acyltransferase family protein [Chitinophagales bacterium]MDW8393340.1 lysophospholipid acyltransferase family protein [Chitinophagales bacterium]
MRKMLHRFGYTVLYGLSLLPLPVWYGLADILFILLYYVVRYRRNVVAQNLMQCFPEWSVRKRRNLEKKYYRHLADLIVESLKALSHSRRQVVLRCGFSECAVELFSRLQEEGRHCIVLMGHLGNWEWACHSMSLQFRFLLQPVYQPIQSPFFDFVFLRLRSRFGVVPISTDRVARQLLQMPDRLTCTVLIADQSPQPQQAKWVPFFHRLTAFHSSGLRLALRSGHPLVYAVVRRIKRGRYLIDAQRLDASAADEAKLLVRFTSLLESDIRKDPSQWLWSHRRWKHQPVQEPAGSTH